MASYGEIGSVRNWYCYKGEEEGGGEEYQREQTRAVGC